MKPELTRSLSALPEAAAAAEAAELLVPSLELEDVTDEATVSGPIVWCTFKNFLSVTFILVSGLAGVIKLATDQKVYT